MDNLKSLEAMHEVLKNFRLIGKNDRAFMLSKLTEEHNVLADTVEDPYTQIKKDYIAAGRRTGNSGNFVFTIKNVREVGNLSLKAAKELVESW